MGKKPLNYHAAAGQFLTSIVAAGTATIRTDSNGIAVKQGDTLFYIADGGTLMCCKQDEFGRCHTFRQVELRQHPDGIYMRNIA